MAVHPSLTAFLLLVGIWCNTACMADNLAGPKATDIIANRDFQQALANAWKESFVGKDLYQMKGGWIYAETNNPDKYFYVNPARNTRSPQATLQDVLADSESVEIDLNNPEQDGIPQGKMGRTYKVVADFHTHPFPKTYQRPGSGDLRRAYERGVPGIVVSCSGIFYYGPERRVSMDGPAGYPQNYNEKYHGQSDTKFGENTVDIDGHCKQT